MIDILTQVDTYFFYFFNSQLACWFNDLLMPFITNKINWIPVWFFIVLYILWKGTKRQKWVLLATLLAVAFSDFSTAHIWKPLFARSRPCVALSHVHLLVTCRHSYSFPSAHAANFFAIATTLGSLRAQYQWLWFALAALVAYSRVAVGVHYPFDVIVGAFWGWGIGKITLILFYKIKLWHYK